jgi:hypothetical protein
VNVLPLITKAFYFFQASLQEVKHFELLVKGIF